jgi:hypothetical protein
VPCRWPVLSYRRCMKGSCVRSTGRHSSSNKSHASAQEQSQASGQNEWTQTTELRQHLLWARRMLRHRLVPLKRLPSSYMADDEPVDVEPATVNTDACGICHSHDDPPTDKRGNRHQFSWVGCVKCPQSYHNTCMGISECRKHYVPVCDNCNK